MTCMPLVPIMAEARKYHILGVAGDSKRFQPRKLTTKMEVLVSIGGSDRPMGYSCLHVENWNPKTKEWQSMSKLPPGTSNKTEYAVCNIKNFIIVTGGRVGQRDVWIYQVPLPLSP